MGDRGLKAGSPRMRGCKRPCQRMASEYLKPPSSPGAPSHVRLLLKGEAVSTRSREADQNQPQVKQGLGQPSRQEEKEGRAKKHTF